MDRNFDVLTFSFILVAVITLNSCFSEKREENPLDLPDYFPNLKEAVGKYYFVPEKKDFSHNDYEYLNLKQGDTLFLDIKDDSTYFFNKIYFNQADSYDNLNGKLSIENNRVTINPDTSKVKITFIYPRGFKKSNKTGIYYYYILSYPTDPTEFGYYIMYKKIN